MPLESRRRRRAALVEMLRGDGYTWEEVATDLRRRERCSALTALRWAHGFSQQDTADNFNKLLTADPDDAPINFRTVHRWEQWPYGGSMPPLSALNRLAKVYQVRASFLFDGEDHRHLDSAYSDQGGDPVTILSRDLLGRPLLAIAPPPPAASTAGPPGLPGEPAPASMLLVLHGRNDMERRAVLAAIASLPGISLPPDTSGSLLEPDAHEIIDHAIQRPESVGTEILTPLHTLIMGCRHLDEVLGARFVAGPANGILRLIGRLLPAVPSTVRPSMFGLAANAAQLAGWLALDAGDDERARRLYDQALEWAIAADDAEFVAYVWCSRAALGRRRVRDPLAAISAAEAARRVAAGRNPTLRAWVERTVGRSYALAGNRSETVHGMERAAELLDEGRPDEAPAWLFHFGPEALLAEHGAALVEVGDGARAAQLLGDALDGLPAAMVRDRGTYLATRALAFKSIGDVGLACAAATEAVSLGMQTGSAWTVAKVDKFHRSLDQRAAQHPDARALGELLRDGAAAVETQHG